MNIAPNAPDHVGALLNDWRAWLDLTTTPPTTCRHQATTLYSIRDGVLVDPDRWPTTPARRVYVALGDGGAVYVGQTNRPLAVRIRAHFGDQRTRPQQLKAGTWHSVVAAAFPELGAGDLDALERSAADWLLPLRQRTGHRHPRKT